MSTPLKSKEELQEDLTKALDRNLEVMIQNAKIGLDRDQWKAIAGELYESVSELVRLKKLKDKCEDEYGNKWMRGSINERNDYIQNQPLAWDAANETLTKYNKLITK